MDRNSDDVGDHTAAGDPRARWRKLPPDVLPTSTSKDPAVRATDFDIAPIYDPRTALMRTFR
ncbi:hypothetical protein [Rhodococcus sp. ARC_M5]|uniref:hypothetical protein n=1 Tax=Rhodococcus sp. ARC_M5 TaxID=2928851 RepID=UPI001FB48994|nr:hypothetical protein [Rhodococcus sp. ARC_M5]MCJ0892894.1 hypothetical protein [Rhodococcus sp. ARC_M5]